MGEVLSRMELPDKRTQERDREAIDPFSPVVFPDTLLLLLRKR
jgi:hypothetical protein